MGPIDVILLLIVVILFVIAAKRTVNKFRSGGCCGCSGCKNGACPHCHSEKN